jgi:rhomboid protease GluP
LIRIRIGKTEQILSWEEWESRVMDGRIAPDCEVQMEAVTGQEYVAAGELELYQSLVQDGAVAWRRSFTSSGPPILTALLVGVQIRIWWWARLPEFADTLVNDYAKWGPPIYENSESWRILTMGFVHIDPFHLVLNMLWLGYTGWNLERALGRANMLTLYLASIVGGSVASLLGSPQSMSVGASGGVFGLVAASVVFGFLRPDLTPGRAKSLYGAALLPYLILMLFSGLTNDGTDNWSHMGGLLTGGVLAFLLDPTPLQRRPRWNLNVQCVSVAVAISLMAGLYLRGVQLYPLIDSEQARWENIDVRRPPPVGDSAVSYRVPKGWEAGRLVGGAPGFRSPLGGAGFGVQVGLTDHPIDLEEAAQRWSQAVENHYSEATITDPFEAQVANRAGIGLNATSASGETLVEWRAATQGCWVLEETWEVSAGRADRLTPLVERLRRAVSWSVPSPLAHARIAYEQLPHSVKIRMSLARALAEAGRLDEALPHWHALIQSNPDNAFVQSGLLETIRWYPNEVPNVNGLLEDMLVHKPAPSTIVDLSTTLAALDRPQEAIGLLEIAWFERPGDRTLKRARRNRGLWTSLDPDTNLPYFQRYDLVTLEEATQPERPEKTFENLANWGRATTTLKQGLARQTRDNIDTNSALAVRAILLLKLGKPPQDVAGAVDGIQEDLLSARWPQWLEPVREVGVTRDELKRLLVFVEASPDQLPRFY